MNQPQSGSPLRRLLCCTASALSLICIACSLPAHSQNAEPASVTTYHNDNERTGANTNEPFLKPANVNPNSFGLLYTLPVDGYVYAQPLYAANVVMGNVRRNVLYVATQHNTVYAFDADKYGPPLWKVNLGPSVPNEDTNSDDIKPEIGITSTPVISRIFNALYVVAKTKEIDALGNPRYVQRLHALGLASGKEKGGGPVELQATVHGGGKGSDGKGNYIFDPLLHNQRPALLLSNHMVYIAFASHGDLGDYHGWVLSYSAKDLHQTGAWVSTEGAGGIWMSGAGPAADSKGNVYFITANGAFDPPNGAYGDSFVKLNTDNGLAATDYFAPADQLTLSLNDEDLGSGGVLLLPDSAGNRKHPHLMVGGGKQGVLYLVDRDWLHEYSATQDVNLQEINTGHGLFGMTAYFNGSLYYGGVGSNLSAYTISGASLSSSPTSQTTGRYGYPGLTPSISSNGSSNGIVWAIQEDGSNVKGPAILHAFDASNLANELYNTAQSGNRDVLGLPVKFAVPTIANGKVYVGLQYGLSVFGLGKWAAPPSITPQNSGIYPNPISVTMKDATPNASIYYTTDNTDPLTSSTASLYTGPFTLSSPASILARAFAPGYNHSAWTGRNLMVGAAAGAGDGLTGAYYPNVNLAGSPQTRIDPTINFTWNGGSPIAGVGGANWSAEWTGQIQALGGTTYTFSVYADDGVRLWIAGNLLVDDWAPHLPRWDTFSIPLQAGQKYPIKIDYFQSNQQSKLILEWSALGLPWQITPQTQLFSH